MKKQEPIKTKLTMDENAQQFIGYNHALKDVLELIDEWVGDGHKTIDINELKARITG